MADKPCRRCEECVGEEHHWSDEYIEYAGDEPEHPAAIAGHEVWLVCKHCDAWKPYDPEADDEWKPYAPEPDLIDLDAIRARWSAARHDNTLVDALSADEARQCVRDLIADLHAVLLTCTVTDAGEPEPVEWAEMAPAEVLRAIESAPRVAGKWERDGLGWWRGVRDSQVAIVDGAGGRWFYDVSMCGDADLDSDIEALGGFATADEAKASADAVLRGLGWMLVDERAA